MRKPRLQLMKVPWWAGIPAKARAMASSDQGRSSEKTARSAATSSRTAAARSRSASHPLLYWWFTVPPNSAQSRLPGRGRALVGHHDRVAAGQQRRDDRRAGDDRGDRDVAVVGAAAVQREERRVEVALGVEHRHALGGGRRVARGLAADREGHDVLARPRQRGQGDGRVLAPADRHQRAGAPARPAAPAAAAGPRREADPAPDLRAGGSPRRTPRGPPVQSRPRARGRRRARARAPRSRCGAARRP